MKMILFFFASLAPPALAFPELVRHGYAHCTACHTNLVGGGLLNNYGRSLSREIVSQKTLAGKAPAEGDEEAFYGLIKPSDKLLLGGDLRVLQLFVESEQASRGRFFIMQLDLDGSYQFNPRWRAFLSVGRIEPQKSEAKAEDFVGLPRYGVEYLFTDPESESRLTMRAGRFMPAYGIAFAEHTFATRRLLDFGPGQEREAVELAWINEKTSMIATGVFSRFSNMDRRKETGGLVQVARQVAEKSKVGLNYYQTERNDAGVKWTRRIQGVFAHLSLAEKWYALFELDRLQGKDGKWGFVETTKLGYEVWQGWHLIGVHEFSRPDQDKTEPRFEAYSLGTDWLPRPHYQLYALYRRERDTALNKAFQDVVWLLGHFYF